MVHQALFIFFGIICVAGAMDVLLKRHAINRARWLVVGMGGLGMIYLLLGAEFVAAIQVIVYAGAIMVLFVFVIMLLNAGAEERSKGSHVALVLGGPGVAIVAGLLTWVMVHSNPQLGSVAIGPSDFGETHAIARLLFRDFLLPFEVTSVLILIAIMGAVVLGRKEN